MSASAVKAGQAYVEIATRQGALNRGLAAATARIGAFSKTVGAIGGGVASKLNFASPFAMLPGLLKVVGMAFMPIISIVGVVIAVFKGLIVTLAGVVGWPVLIIGAFAALGAAILLYTNAGSDALSMFGQAWQGLLDTVMPIIRAIVNTLMSGDFQKAGVILWTSMQLLWYNGINSLYNMWLDFQTGFLNAIDPFVQPLMEMWAGIRDAAIWYIDQVKNAWTSFWGPMIDSIGSIEGSWSTMVQSMSDMWNDTVNWIAKKLLYLYSLFDWSFDYEMAAKDMDATNEAKKRANREGGKQRIQARKDEAEALKDSFGGEIADLRKKLEMELEGVNTESFDLKMPEALGNMADKVKEVATAAAAAIPLVDMSMGAQKGTFSGFAAMNMGSQTDDAATRQRAEMIKQLEAEAKLTRKLLERFSTLTTVLGARP